MIVYFFPYVHVPAALLFLCVSSLTWLGSRAHILYSTLFFNFSCTCRLYFNIPNQTSMPKQHVHSDFPHQQFSNA